MQRIYVMQSTHRDMRGFEYLVYSIFSLTLLLVLIFLPLAPVFADEVVPDTTSSPTIDAPIDSPPEPSPSDVADSPSDEEVETTVVTDSSVSPTDVVTPAESSPTDTPSDTMPSSISETDQIGDTNPPPDAGVITDNGGLDTTVPQEATDVPQTAGGATDSATDSENPDLVSTTTESTPPVAVPMPPEQGTTTSELPIDELVAPLPDSTIQEVLAESTTTLEAVIDVPVPDSVVEVSSVTTDENRFIFSKQDCTSAGDNMFYCVGGDTEVQPTQIDRVFSAPDEVGDKEIFMERGGVVTQITQNDEDDDAPYYDALSNTLVWHRLIDGRYQIVSHDVASEEEEVLTHDRYNNMEPNRYGDVTVWQGWVGNDWEIMMLDGDTLSMLSDNTTNDITPSINGDYIVWQSFEGAVWRMKVYDIRTKHIETIEDTNGGSIENPRFVLVYDTKFESGDVETRGYNLESGEVVPLDSTPAPVPQEIPDPEQTGEERALVTPIPQPKSKVGETEDGTTSGDGNLPPPDTGDIVVPPFPSEAIASTTEDVSDSPTNVVPDVVVQSESASSSVAHIEDIVVTPYTLETTETASTTESL